MDQVHVVITGSGAISPLGSNGERMLEALAEARHGFVAIESIDPAITGVFWAGSLSFRPEDHFGDKNYRTVDRTGQLVLIAAGAALEGAGLDSETLGERDVGLVVGTFYGSINTIAAFDRRGMEAGPKYVKPLDFANSVINAAGGQAAIWHDLRGVNSTVTGGGSAGLQAIAQAFDLIRSGRSFATLAGGAEELSLESLLSFARSGKLAAAGPEAPPRCEPFREPSGSGPGGMVLSEGAAFLVLEEDRAAAERGARPLGQLLGHGSAFDPSRFSDLKPAAEAIARAIEIALEDARIEATDIDLLVVSANGLAALDHAEALALERVFGNRLAVIPFLAPKRGLGESLGAGGAFATLVALAALRKGEAPAQPGLALDPALRALRPPLDSAKLTGRRALVLGLSLDGIAAALVIEAAEADR